MKLSTPNIPSLDYMILNKYVSAEFPNSTRFNPSSHIFVTVSFPYKLNWLLMWCIAFELTDGFAYNELTHQKNFFAVPGLSVSTWGAGILIGVQRIAVASGYNPAMIDNMHEEVSKAQEFPRSGKALVDTTDLPELYSQDRWPNLSERVINRYNSAVEFWTKGGAKPPETEIKLPDTPEPPKVDKPKEPEQSVPDNSTPPTSPKPKWKTWLAGIVGTVSALLFIAQWFLPGGVVQIIKTVLELLKQLIAF